MRILWEIFTLFIGIGVIFAIAKGFPQFGQILRAVLLNPIGLIGLAGFVFVLIVLRKRAAGRRLDSEG